MVKSVEMAVLDDLQVRIAASPESEREALFYQLDAMIANLRIRYSSREVAPFKVVTRARAGVASV